MRKIVRPVGFDPDDDVLIEQALAQYNLEFPDLAREAVMKHVVDLLDSRIPYCDTCKSTGIVERQVHSWGCQCRWAEVYKTKGKFFPGNPNAPRFATDRPPPPGKPPKKE